MNGLAQLLVDALNDLREARLERNEADELYAVCRECLCAAFILLGEREQQVLRAREQNVRLIQQIRELVGIERAVHAARERAA